jgi:hypothetical protein
MTPQQLNLVAACMLTALSLMSARIPAKAQTSGRVQWYQCIRSKTTHERQAVMGSKVLFLGQGPFRESRLPPNPKFSISPGWQQGECLIDTR